MHGHNRAGNIPHSLASVYKAKDLLGYNPQNSMKDGFRKVISWYRGNLKLETRIITKQGKSKNRYGN